MKKDVKEFCEQVADDYQRGLITHDWAYYCFATINQDLDYFLMYRKGVEE